MSVFNVKITLRKFAFVVNEKNTITNISHLLENIDCYITLEKLFRLLSDPQYK